MPAILVLKDMPSNCKKCPCQMMWVCVPTDEDIDEYINPSKTKPNWCPLRYLPSKRHIPITKTFGTPFNKGKVKGWNDCIDEITGEKDESSISD